MPLCPIGGCRGLGGVAAIGAGVPIASVLAAFLTGVTWEPTTRRQTSRSPAVAWGCALLISVGGMITSLILALAGPDATELNSTRRARLNAEKPVSTRTRSTWWGAGVEATRPV